MLQGDHCSVLFESTLTLERLFLRKPSKTISNSTFELIFYRTVSWKFMATSKGFKKWKLNFPGHSNCSRPTESQTFRVWLQPQPWQLPSRSNINFVFRLTVSCPIVPLVPLFRSRLLQVLVHIPAQLGTNCLGLQALQKVAEARLCFLHMLLLHLGMLLLLLLLYSMSVLIQQQ